MINNQHFNTIFTRFFQGTINGKNLARDQDVMSNFLPSDYTSKMKQFFLTITKRKSTEDE